MIKIKKLYESTRVAFGASGLPLKLRSQEEIVDLALIAQESQDKTLIVLFQDPLPSVAELKKMKMKFRIQQQTKPPAVETKQKQWSAQKQNPQLNQKV